MKIKWMIVTVLLFSSEIVWMNAHAEQRPEVIESESEAESPYQAKLDREAVEILKELRGLSTEIFGTETIRRKAYTQGQRDRLKLLKERIEKVAVQMRPENFMYSATGAVALSFELFCHDEQTSLEEAVVLWKAWGHLLNASRLKESPEVQSVLTEMAGSVLLFLGLFDIEGSLKLIDEVDTRYTASLNAGQLDQWVMIRRITLNNIYGEIRDKPGDPAYRNRVRLEIVRRSEVLLSDNRLSQSVKNTVITETARKIYDIGDAESAHLLMEKWEKEMGDENLDGGFLHLHFCVLWYGLGDTEKSSAYVKKVENLIRKGRIKEEDEWYKMIVESYHSRITLSDEQRRVEAEAKRKQLAETDKLRGQVQ